MVSDCVFLKLLYARVISQGSPNTFMAGSTKMVCNDKFQYDKFQYDNLQYDRVHQNVALFPSSALQHQPLRSEGWVCSWNRWNLAKVGPVVKLWKCGGSIFFKEIESESETGEISLKVLRPVVMCWGVQSWWWVLTSVSLYQLWPLYFKLTAVDECVGKWLWFVYTFS